jgi:hypothetical protein
MRVLQEFCKERKLNLDLVKKEYGDLIIETGGQLFIDAERFEAELPLRGKRIARKRTIRGVTQSRTSIRIWNTANHGLLRAAIPRKQKQIARLEAEIPKLVGKIEQVEDANKKAALTIKLQSIRAKHEQAQSDLPKMEARLQELAEAVAHVK